VLLDAASFSQVFVVLVFDLEVGQVRRLTLRDVDDSGSHPGREVLGEFVAQACGNGRGRWGASRPRELTIRPDGRYNRCREDL
jgi:hypothetical protein